MRFSGNILVALGVLGFMGGMAIKEPTVEKINMALGAPFVFALGFGLQVLATLLTKFESLQTQIEELRRGPERASGNE